MLAGRRLGSNQHHQWGKKENKTQLLDLLLMELTTGGEIMVVLQSFGSFTLIPAVHFQTTFISASSLFLCRRSASPGSRSSSCCQLSLGPHCCYRLFISLLVLIMVTAGRGRRVATVSSRRCCCQESAGDQLASNLISFQLLLFFTSETAVSRSSHQIVIE